jgi:hypothetical protein
MLWFVYDTLNTLLNVGASLATFLHVRQGYWWHLDHVLSEGSIARTVRLE